MQPNVAIIRAVSLYLLMQDNRGEPEKVLMFARFFRGSFDGLAAEVEVAAFLHFSSAEGIHRLEGQAGFLIELEEARIVLVTGGVQRAGEVKVIPLGWKDLKMTSVGGLSAVYQTSSICMRNWRIHGFFVIIPSSLLACFLIREVQVCLR